MPHNKHNTIVKLKNVFYHKLLNTTSKHITIKLLADIKDKFSEEELKNRWEAFINDKQELTLLEKSIFTISHFPTHEDIDKTISSNKQQSSVKKHNKQINKQESVKKADQIPQEQLLAIDEKLHMQKSATCSKEIWYPLPLNNDSALYVHKVKSTSACLQGRYSKLLVSLKKNNIERKAYLSAKNAASLLLKVGSYEITDLNTLNLLNNNLEKIEIVTTDKELPHKQDLESALHLKYKELRNIKNLSSRNNNKKLLNHIFNNDNINYLEKNYNAIQSKQINKLQTIGRGDCKTPFAYVGNSLSYLKHIHEMLNSANVMKNTKRIYDITCGSGTVTFYLANLFPDMEFIMSDVNPYIIQGLNLVKKNPDLLKEIFLKLYNRIEKLSGYDNKNTEFQKILKEFKAETNEDIRAAYFIFIQNQAYKGVRYTSSNHMNASLKKTACLKPTNFNKNIDFTHATLSKSNIKILQADINDILKNEELSQSLVILTPTHHSDPTSSNYYGYTDEKYLLNIINNANKNHIPLIITYGDNVNYRAMKLPLPYRKFSIAKQNSDSDFQCKRMLTYANADLNLSPEWVTLNVQKAQRKIDKWSTIYTSNHSLTSITNAEKNSISEVLNILNYEKSLLNQEEKSTANNIDVKKIEAGYPITNTVMYQQSNKSNQDYMSDWETESLDSSDMEMDNASKSLSSKRYPLNEDNSAMHSNKKQKKESDGVKSIQFYHKSNHFLFSHSNLISSPTIEVQDDINLSTSAPIIKN